VDANHVMTQCPVFQTALAFEDLTTTSPLPCNKDTTVPHIG